MKFLNIREQKILFEYLKQNMGWFCLENNSFQKKCKQRCWLHCFFGELDFVSQNNYMSSMEQHTFFDRMIKKYRSNFSNDFEYFFNDDLIERVIVKVENN